MLKCHCINVWHRDRTWARWRSKLSTETRCGSRWWSGEVAATVVLCQLVPNQRRREQVEVWSQLPTSYRCSSRDSRQPYRLIMRSPSTPSNTPSRRRTTRTMIIADSACRSLPVALPACCLATSRRELEPYRNRPFWEVMLFVCLLSCNSRDVAAFCDTIKCGMLHELCDVTNAVFECVYTFLIYYAA